jgi:hypothetical protein
VVEAVGQERQEQEAPAEVLAPEALGFRLQSLVPARHTPEAAVAVPIRASGPEARAVPVEAAAAERVAVRRLEQTARQTAAAAEAVAAALKGKGRPTTAGLVS